MITESSKKVNKNMLFFISRFSEIIVLYLHCQSIQPLYSICSTFNILEPKFYRLILSTNSYFSGSLVLLVIEIYFSMVSPGSGLYKLKNPWLMCFSFFPWISYHIFFWYKVLLLRSLMIISFSLPYESLLTRWPKAFFSCLIWSSAILWNIF